MASPAASVQAVNLTDGKSHEKAVLTPPTSEDWNKNDGSDLSDLEEEHEEEDIVPDHYWDGGEIPVFKPTMAQFRSFKDFVAKIDKYGMKSGIVKVIPPKEWIDALPPLDEAVKGIRVKNPITQEFAGTHGTYTQANIEKQRSYNLPQWKALTEESQHQPPARRGERRKNTDKPLRAPPKPREARAAPVVSADGSVPAKRRPGRPRKNPLPPVETSIKNENVLVDEDKVQGPPTPTSPEAMSKELDAGIKELSIPPSFPETTSDKPMKPKPKARQPRASGASQSKSVSQRRKYNRHEVAGEIDEAAFEGFDYRVHSKDFTPERCAELETNYWKTLTFAPPMYGADMPGSLFDDTTTSWNVAKLENVLDVLGQKVPGVNTAYLYLGMWKATYAWHLEDVDLYSINYIHFGAPKQWYSISQEDARRFETAMKSIWPHDAKNCSQFLRHKTYLISPAVLQSQFNIRVNKLVHYEGEFVITYPYGYHSGYNLGYNCAESVNFATESWLEYGKIAKKCDCEADSVWIDVEDIERKLRGEPTPEYYEETDDDLDEDDSHLLDLPSPPASVVGKAKPGRKRTREQSTATTVKPFKKIKIRLKTYVEPCVLCPNDMPFESLLQTDTGRYAHRVCALYTPETYLDEDDGPETVCGIASIDKARLDLKCSFCRSRKGACFQCSAKKCTRAFHATCAAAAGVQVDYGPVPVYGDDGIEYASTAYDFRCRFHRAKRPKTTNGDSLENNSLVQDFAKTLEPNHVVQMQYPQGEVFAGVVIENRLGEQSILTSILPDGDRVEVEWKYILVMDPADSQLPKLSADAKPLPAHMDRLTVQSRNLEFGPPQADDLFGDPQYHYKWAEFNTAPAFRNAAQVKTNVEKANQFWYYLGKTSTEAKAQFTENVTLPRHNTLGNFLETVKPMLPVVKKQPAASVSRPGVNYHALNGAMANAKRQSQTPQQPYRLDRPYEQAPRAGQPTPASDLYYDARKMSQSQTNPTTQPNYISQAPMYMNRPQPSAAWPPAQHISPYARTAQGNQNYIKYEQQSAQLRPSGMLPLADLLGRPESPAVEEPRTAAETDYLSHIAQYPYLKNSFLRRPKTYQSPYKSGAGYSSIYAVADSSTTSGTQTTAREAPTVSYQTQSFTSQAAEHISPYVQPSRYSYIPNARSQPADRSFIPYQYQYQSPQAFQEQVKRESSHNHEERHVDKLYNQIRNAATAATSQQQTDDRPGSLDARAQRPYMTSAVATIAPMSGHINWAPQAPAPMPPAM